MLALPRFRTSAFLSLLANFFDDISLTFHVSLSFCRVCLLSAPCFLRHLAFGPVLNQPQLASTTLPTYSLSWKHPGAFPTIIQRPSSSFLKTTFFRSLPAHLLLFLQHLDIISHHRRERSLRLRVFSALHSTVSMSPILPFSSLTSDPSRTQG